MKNMIVLVCLFVQSLSAQWVPANGQGGNNVLAFAVSGANIFAGTDLGTILSTDNGTSWNVVNTGLTNSYVNALAVSGTNLFAGMNYMGAWGDQYHAGGVWRRPLSQLMTSVENRERLLPRDFELDHNYPNPFNPLTTIRYALPSSAHVKLTVYNMLGQAVTELVNKEQTAGWKEVHWNAQNFASGMYFCKLTSGNFVQTRKMLLMK